MDKTIIKPRPGKGADFSDRTIIKPRPAGSSADIDKTMIKPRKINNIASNPPIELTKNSNKTDKAENYELTSLPKLIKKSSLLLAMISQLKQLDGNIDIESLHGRFEKLLEKFIFDSNKITDKETTKKASYALCATIDEAILNTPWGETSNWSQKPLLSKFHNETYGGEKFYTILDSEITANTKNYELIELLYLCLSLGFMGKLRIDKNGPIEVEKIRSNSYQLLTKNRNRFTRQLSKKTNAINTEKIRLYSFLPIWLLAALLTLSAFAIYNHWLFTLNKASDKLITEMATLTPTKKETSLNKANISKNALLLRQLLQHEIIINVLSIEDYANRSAIILHSNNLFSSGSANISAAFQPVLDKISKALEAIPGRIIISGHTDNIAIRSSRYPSNWHLSLARASAVGKYMSSSADLKTRLLPEGRGDSEPIAKNSTAEGRAKNRRVTIEIFYDNMTVDKN
ncbi:MAG: type VI secretion system protein TssL, long form [Cellvibrionaceae bacterium]|nr:type VI secretion system protein TssL, long form [Cellvibrionaceae bacterium]